MRKRHDVWNAIDAFERWLIWGKKTKYGTRSTDNAHTYSTRQPWHCVLKEAWACVHWNFSVHLSKVRTFPLGPWILHMIYKSFNLLLVIDFNKWVNKFIKLKKNKFVLVYFWYAFISQMSAKNIYFSWVLNGCWDFFNSCIFLCAAYLHVKYLINPTTVASHSASLYCRHHTTTSAQLEADSNLNGLSLSLKISTNSFHCAPSCSVTLLTPSAIACSVSSRGPSTVLPSSVGPQLAL